MTDHVRRVLWVAGWPARSALLAAIALYRLTLGQVIGGSCRFHPSCSAYAAQAVRNVGAIRGVGLAVWRVLRCSPFSRGGLDPAPAPRQLYDADIHLRSAA